MGWQILSGQVAAEPLVSSRWAQYVWLVIKNKIGEAGLFWCISVLPDYLQKERGLSSYMPELSDYSQTDHQSCQNCTTKSTLGMYDYPQTEESYP